MRTTSEALRIEAVSPTPQTIVNTFIATQASSVAHAYDAAVPPTETENSTETPEVYASYPPTGRPYFEDIDAAATALVNFYNIDDFALSGWWMLGQDAKPNVPEGYSYPGYWFHLVPPRQLHFPVDRYEIYSHIAEARSLALGRQAGVMGPFDVNKQVDLRATFGFTGSEEDHSAQFRGTNQLRWAYWRQLLVSSGVIA